MSQPERVQPQPERVHRDRGSALMLMPAAVLVLFVLGALVVDSATVWLGQRQLQNAAEVAATDAASAVADAPYYSSGRVVLDPAAAQWVALASLAADRIPGVTLTDPPAIQVSGRQVCVSLTGTVRPVFGRAVPGFGVTTTVHGRATATVAGDAGTAVPHRAIC